MGRWEKRDWDCSALCPLVRPPTHHRSHTAGFAKCGLVPRRSVFGSLALSPRPEPSAFGPLSSKSVAFALPPWRRRAPVRFHPLAFPPPRVARTSERRSLPPLPPNCSSGDRTPNRGKQRTTHDYRPTNPPTHDPHHPSHLITEALSEAYEIHPGPIRNPPDPSSLKPLLTAPFNGRSFRQTPTQTHTTHLTPSFYNIHIKPNRSALSPPRLPTLLR